MMMSQMFHEEVDGPKRANLVKETGIELWTTTGLNKAHLCGSGLQLLLVSTKFIPKHVAYLLPGFLRKFGAHLGHQRHKV